MTPQTAFTLVVLLATLGILATQRLRPDLVALLAVLALILGRVLDPGEAFGAFGQPVIVIVPSIYVLGAALYETGVATLIANGLLRFSDRGTGLLLLVIMLTAGLLSAVLSSLLVVAVLMPAVLRIARQARRAPAQLLLPLVTAATMGNLLTLIGTISNLVVSDLLVVSGHDPLGLFSLTPYGLVSLGLAMAWFLLTGRWLLRREISPEPQVPSLEEVEQAYRLDDQLYRLRVRSVSDLIATRLDDSELGPDFGLNVVAVQRPGDELRPAGPEWVLERDDVLVVEGSRGSVLQAASLHRLEPKGTMPLDRFSHLEQETLRLAELMVPFRSPWVGKTLAEIHFRERYGLNVLAVHRQGRAIHDGLPQLTLAPGDTLLVQGPQNRLHQAEQDRNLILTTHLGPQAGDLVTDEARLTLGILGVMLACVISGWLSLATASLAATVALVLAGCIDAERAYQSIDGSIVVLIGGMLPLAMALEKSGVAELIALWITGLSQGLGTPVMLLLLYLFTAGVTQIISNSVTAALMTPIAVNLAVAQGLSPRPFAIAVIIGVTTSFLTPLTNTDNLLVREAGQYRMRDYLVNGGAIFLLQALALLSMLVIL